MAFDEVDGVSFESFQSFLSFIERTEIYSIQSNHFQQIGICFHLQTSCCKKGQAET